jgi:hypothetical protein
VKTQGAVENLLIHYRNGDGHGHQAECKAEVIKVLEWVLGPPVSAETAPERLKSIELYGWLGEDELGSGEVGLKQGLVPAGYIPLVAVSLMKMLPLAEQLDDQAAASGNRIYLCRFTFAEALMATKKGEPLPKPES